MAWTRPRTVVLDDDGQLLVWRRPLIVRIVVPLLTLAFLGTVTALAVDDVSPGLIAPVLLYVAFTWIIGWGTWRTRIVVNGDRLTVTTYRGTRSSPLAQVTDASSGYYGMTIRLADGTTLSSSLAATANGTRWRGRVSRGDLKAALILGRAEKARGGAGFPRTVVGTRGPGDLVGGIIGAVSAFLRP